MIGIRSSNSDPAYSSNGEGLLALGPMSYWRVFLFLTVVLVLCYSPVLFAIFGFSDDYTELLAHQMGSTYPWAFRMASGRPLDAILNYIYFLPIPNVGSLRYLRFFAVIEVALIAWVTYLILRYAEWERWQAFCASLIIVSLPPFQVYVSYAITVFYPVSILLAAGAFYFSELAISQGFRKDIAAISVLLISFAVMTYQPGAMFFWSFAAMVMFRPDARPSFLVRRFCWYSATFVPAMGLGLCAYLIGKKVYGIGLIGPERAAVAHDLVAKARWFLHGPLRDSLNLANLFPTRTVATLVACFVAVGLLLYFQRGIGERFANTMFAVLLVPLSYMPNLVTAENWSSYRTQPALASLIAVYVLLSMRGFVSLVARRYRSTIANAVLSGTVSFCLILAAYHVDAYFAVPQTVELELMRREIEKQDPAHRGLVYIISGENPGLMAPGARYDEFGVASSARPWAAGPQAALLLRSLGVRRRNLSIRVICSEPLRRPPLARWLAEQSIYVSISNGREDPDRGATVVDMSRLDALR